MALAYTWKKTPNFETGKEQENFNTTVKTLKTFSREKAPNYGIGYCSLKKRHPTMELVIFPPYFL